MISAVILRDRRLAAKKAKDAGVAETERITARLARARTKRAPFYLSRDEFLAICRWQLGEQYPRSARLLEANSDKRIRRISKLAFSVKDKDREFDLLAQITILRLLPGVGLGVASAVLALCYPKRYAAVDGPAWSALFDEPRKNLEVGDYGRYLARIGELEAELRSLDPKGRWCPQLVGRYAGARSDGTPSDSPS